MTQALSQEKKGSGGLPVDADRIDARGPRAGKVMKQDIVGRPLVSVITVVFNGAATIECNIQSVLSQDYENIEHIIIDGGSTDGTIEILQKYDDRIDHWISEKDAGIYDAMNKGIAMASGKYIGMLNADDFFFDASSMGKIVGRLEESGADAVFSCLDIVDPVNTDRVLRKYRIPGYSRFWMRIGAMPPHPTFYCKRTCYENAGLYRTDYHIAADAEMMMRLLLKHSITWSFIDETTVKMRAGGTSSNGLKANWLGNREIIRACAENGLYTNLLLLAFKVPLRLLERVL